MCFNAANQAIAARSSAVATARVLFGPESGTEDDAEFPALGGPHLHWFGTGARLNSAPKREKMLPAQVADRFTMIRNAFTCAGVHLSHRITSAMPSLRATLSRPIHLTERAVLYVRAEYFNVFNHPMFSPPDVFSPTFGQVYQTLNVGLRGLNALYQIGGRDRAVYAEATFLERSVSRSALPRQRPKTCPTRQLAVPPART